MVVRYELGAIVVTDSKLFNRTGQVRRWAESVNIRFVKNAIAEAPDGRAKRPTGNKTSTWAAYPTGSLKASITGDVVRIGPRQLQTTVKVGVPYAIFVIRGTKDIGSTFRTRDAQGLFTGTANMVLPPNFVTARGRSYKGGVPTNTRRGQKANNFLERAFDKTARVNRSLRGFQMIG